MRPLPAVLVLATCGAPLAIDVSPMQDLVVQPTGPASPTARAAIPETGCPVGTICVDTLPYVDTNTTTDGPRTYRVTLTEPGLLAATLLAATLDGQDVNVRLADRDGGKQGAAWLPAGSFSVVVDGRAGDAYTLALHQTRPGDFVADGLAEDVLETALVAFDRAWGGGDTERLEYGVIDFSLPSTSPRFFVLDLRRGGLLFRERTSHGKGSQDPNDQRMAGRFSNISGSNMSSLGLMRAAETYTGDHGLSLKLDGLEPGFSDNVRRRSVVIHPADYATDGFVDSWGYLGRSQGCPALDPQVSASLIDTMANGALILSYYPDPAWLSASQYLN